MNLNLIRYDRVAAVWLAYLLLTFNCAGVFAQTPPLTHDNLAQIEIIEAADPKLDTGDTAQPIARLMHDLILRGKIEVARKMTPRLIADILKMPDKPFEYFQYCSFEELVGDFEKAKCESDAQQLLTACYEKEAHAKSPECTSPVAIDVAWFSGQFRSDPLKWEAAKELWLSTIEKVNGPDSIATAFVCHRRAEILLEEKHYAQAMPYIQRMARILSTKNSDREIDHLRQGCYSIACLGNTCIIDSQNLMGEQVYEIAINLGKSFGNKYCKPVDAELWLAFLYSRTGRIEQAQVLVQRAVLEASSKLPESKRHFAPDILQVTKECIELDDYEIPLVVLPLVVKTDYGGLDDREMYLQLTNAFARLDNGKLACKNFEKVIELDRMTENNSACVESDLQQLEHLRELNKKHVELVGTHRPTGIGK